MVPLLQLLACGPYARWPDPTEVFPYDYSPQEGLEEYETVRWETETWDTTDPTMTGLYVQKSFFHRPEAPAEELEHFRAMKPGLPPLGPGIRLGFVGDIMFIDQSTWSSYTQPAHALLEGVDLRVGNLETPTSVDHSYEPRALGLYAFNAPPQILDGLPVDVLQLTNNHSLDAGDLGLSNTKEEVESRGLVPVGIDTQAEVQVAGSSVALLAFTWGINGGLRSDEHALNIVPFGHLDDEHSLQPIRDQIEEASDRVDLVVVLVHWGFEYEYYPDPHFMILAREIIAMGADLVVGQGPHVAQPPEICSVDQPDVVPGIGTCSIRTERGEPRTAAVLYSLGNFGTEMLTVPTQVGLVATVSLDSTGVTGLGWQAVASIKRDGQPLVVPLSSLTDEPAYAEESARLALHLGSSWAQ